MRQKNQILSLVARVARSASMMMALLTAGVLTCGCSDVMDEPASDKPAGSRMITLTTTVSLGDGAMTRALTDGGVKTFVPGDKIAVKYWKRGQDWAEEMVVSNELQSTNITDGGKTATFTVTIDDPDPNNTGVRYIYPDYMESDDGRIRILQTEQDGTLATLASKFDYCEGTGDIDHSGTTPALPTIALENKLAIGVFSLNDGTNDITGVKSLVFNDGTYEYEVTNKNTAADAPIYVAMMPVASTQTITLGASTASGFYKKSFSGKPLYKDNLYPITATLDAMAESDLTTPLTIEAKEFHGSSVEIGVPDGGTMEYRMYTKDHATDTWSWSEWMEYTGGVHLDHDGCKVSFRGNNTSFISKCITVGDNCYVYGNVMSIISATAFPISTVLKYDYTFYQLFGFCGTNIYSHATRQLVLPATKLTFNCYCSMFSGCSNLSKAPDLPATTLNTSCYDRMFEGCTSLTTAPALPATEMLEGSYSKMFKGCTSLTTAPELPATTLRHSCYWNMFEGCTNLTTAPTLSATTLDYSCYSEMFKNCSKLHSVTMLASDPDSKDFWPLENWLEGAGTDGGTGGTVTVHSSLHDGDDLYEYIEENLPSGWTITVATP